MSIKSRFSQLVLSIITLFALALAFQANSASAVSPGANGKIYYNALQGIPSPLEFNTGLWSSNENGTGLTSVSTVSGATPLVNYKSTFSPNGQTVIFSKRFSGSVNNYNLYSKNADGTGGETQLTIYPSTGKSYNEGAVEPVYSPDGSKITFVSNHIDNATWQIYRMDPNGSSVQQLTNTSGSGAVAPDYSPDGSKIVYAESSQYGSIFTELYTMNADGTGETELLGHGGGFSDFAPSWSPDGTKILFSSNRNSGFNTNLFQINADGTGLTQLTNYSGTFLARQGVWSPDGTKIAYIRSNTDSGATELYTMNANGTNPTLRNPTNIYNPSFPNWQQRTAGVVIIEEPDAISNDPNPDFVFNADDPLATYECQVDSGGWNPCSSPATYALANGPHTFDVRAINNAGTGPVTSYSWTINTSAPEVTITSGPPLVTQSTSANFTFTSDTSPVTYECKLDGATSWTTCSNPKNYTGLGLGDHSLQVRAKDAAGNVSEPADYNWQVIAATPSVDITSGPKNGKSTEATFKFKSDTPGSSFRCRLDNASFSRCTSPKKFKNLKFGPHRFQVQVTDPQGNKSLVAEWNWNVTDKGKCKISNIRSRFFVYTKKDAVRLVAKYKASNKGAVRVKFYERKKNGSKGRFVGATQTKFKKSPKKFGFFRVKQPRPDSTMKRLRKVKHGFVADLTVLSSPGYCKRLFNTKLQLTVKRKVQKQNVWFQSGSFGSK